MSRDRRGNGVQVVGGSNPPCPTKPQPHDNFATPQTAKVSKRLAHCVWCESVTGNPIVERGFTALRHVAIAPPAQSFWQAASKEG
jgi:hypothetical protein